MSRAGLLSERIEFQEATQTRSSTGQVIDTWTRLFRAGARVDSMDATERFQAGRETGYKMKFFTVRYRSEIGPQHRILYKEQQYNIRSIKTLERYGREKFMMVTGEIVEEAPGEE